VKLAEMVEELDLKVRTGDGAMERELSGGYASDLMSDVIAHAAKGHVWVTLQIHQNVVAVASLKELAGIVLVNGREPEEATVERAESENIPIMVSPLTAFDVIGRLYALGVTGGTARGGERGKKTKCEP
jgi:hypothetical protein